MVNVDVKQWFAVLVRAFLGLELGCGLKTDRVERTREHVRRVLTIVGRHHGTEHLAEFWVVLTMTLVSRSMVPPVDDIKGYVVRADFGAESMAVPSESKPLSSLRSCSPEVRDIMYLDSKATVQLLREWHEPLSFGPVKDFLMSVECWCHDVQMALTPCVGAELQ